MILGQCVLMSVRGIERNDAFVIIGEVDGVILRDVVIEVQEHIVFHIHLRCIGVHPEHIRHLAAGSAGFQKRPVLIPGDDIDFHRNAGSLRPFICDLLKSCELVVVPDIDLKSVTA